MSNDGRHTSTTKPAKDRKGDWDAINAALHTIERLTAPNDELRRLVRILSERAGILVLAPNERSAP